MTHRPEYQPSAIERATRRVIDAMNTEIPTALRAEGLPTENTQINEEQFRRMLVLYFHGRSIREWATDFGMSIDDADELERSA